jgi:putative FmdB family regulatory protein
MEDCGCDRQSFEDAMPLYEYRCQVCGEMEEKIQSYSAPTKHDCSKCAATDGMTRQISKVAFNMSGGGWYAEGYSAKEGSAPSKGVPVPSKETAPSTPSTEGGCCSGGCACKPGA